MSTQDEQKRLAKVFQLEVALKYMQKESATICGELAKPVPDYKRIQIASSLLATWARFAKRRSRR